jgi:hypothetical protein
MIDRADNKMILGEKNRLGTRYRRRQVYIHIQSGTDVDSKGKRRIQWEIITRCHMLLLAVTNVIFQSRDAKNAATKTWQHL